MIIYKNTSGVSNVHSYEYTADSITVRFKDEMSYIYSTLKNSFSTIEQLKQLADQGFGLNSALARKGHPSYDRKWI
jgi:hypothetical protein